MILYGNTELVGYAPCLQLVESDMALALLRRISLFLFYFPWCDPMYSHLLYPFGKYLS